MFLLPFLGRWLGRRLLDAAALWRSPAGSKVSESDAPAAR